MVYDGNGKTFSCVGSESHGTGLSYYYHFNQGDIYIKLLAFEEAEKNGTDDLHCANDCCQTKLSDG